MKKALSAVFSYLLIDVVALAIYISLSFPFLYKDLPGNPFHHGLEMGNLFVALFLMSLTAPLLAFDCKPWWSLKRITPLIKVQAVCFVLLLISGRFGLPLTVKWTCLMGFGLPALYTFPYMWRFNPESPAPEKALPATL